MEQSEYLRKIMPTFMRKDVLGNVMEDFEKEDAKKVVADWAKFLNTLSLKELVPLFITGSGVSYRVSSINKIIEKLQNNYRESNINDPQISHLFERWTALDTENKKDRGLVASILNAFQTPQKNQEQEIEALWDKLNKDLLEEIIKADPTAFHNGLAKLYHTHNAMCLTLNFDGLLIRALLKSKGVKKAFSLPTKEELEGFFLRPVSTSASKELVEIQIRGDILYLRCKAKDYCSQQNKGPVPLWSAFTIEEIRQMEDEKKRNDIIEKAIKCPACSGARESYLSFPGSSDKEKDMKNMLEIIWKYLAHKVGAVTIVGMSGEWDPLIIAFLGDLLSERNIPLLVIDKDADSEKTYVIRELVTPNIHYAVALKTTADQFMNALQAKVETEQPSIIKLRANRFEQKRTLNDEYWKSLIEKDSDLSSIVNFRISSLEEKIYDLLEKEKLNRFAQLGLKSRWLGIIKGNPLRKYHTRLHHSIGVLIIASYLYDKAVENSNLKVNPNERQFLRLAALLHDAGHIPFSHLIEDVFKELKWRPAGYRSEYSHLFQTEEKVKELFNNDKDLKKDLYSLGYSVTELIQLIKGCFGVGFLDAIINSAIDADKIDYIFRDTTSTQKPIPLKPIPFLKEFTNKKNFRVTPERLLALTGRAAKASVELLQTRKFLYTNLYRKPAIVILEALAKLIIKTYFVHVVELDNKDYIERIKTEKITIPDLGHYKIMFCIKEMERLFADIEKDVEFRILEKMVDALKNRNLSLGIKTTTFHQLLHHSALRSV